MSDKPSPEVQALIEKAKITPGEMSFSECYQRLLWAGMARDDAEHWAPILAEPEKTAA